MLNHNIKLTGKFPQANESIIGKSDLHKKFENFLKNEL
jgi:hypothetical protein